jgi:parallel beta-helix repeat protein
MSNAFENTLTSNNVTENYGWAVYLEGDQKNNTIHHNNFISNKNVDGLQVYIKMLWIYPGLNYKGSPSEAPLPELVPGAGNYWDNGREGNYWSSYNGTDNNQDGIGDTPYIINEKNQDNYPLMNPIDTTPPPDTSLPIISVISPENKTYTASDVSLTFTVSESTIWIAYSLDGQANVTITGNTTLSGSSNGSHSLIVYANDTAGNIGASETIYFSIAQQEPFPTTWIVAATAIIAIAAVAAVLIYFRKIKKTTGKVERVKEGMNNTS